MNEVLERIKELLKNQHVKAKRMCEDIGISVSTYYTWRQRNTTPDSDSLAKIADYFGVTTDYLLTGKEDARTDESGYYYDPAVAKMAEELKNNAGMRVLLDASRDLKMEDLMVVVDFVNKMKRGE